MRLHFPKVTVVADVVANSILIHVAPVHLPAGDALGHVECFEDGAGVGLPAPEIVDLGDARRLPELIHEAGHILGMDVVADLLAFVSEDLILASFDVAFQTPVVLQTRRSRVYRDRSANGWGTACVKGGTHSEVLWHGGAGVSVANPCARRVSKLIDRELCVLI